jgi:hypothetical protein
MLTAEDTCLIPLRSFDNNAAVIQIAAPQTTIIIIAVSLLSQEDTASCKFDVWLAGY